MSNADQVLAKVRAAATRALENMTCLCVGEGGRTPVATCKHCHGSAYLVTDETVCARAALAMVELRKTLADGAQCQRRHAADCDKQHDDEGARLCRVSAMEYEWVVARIDDALRTAVASE